MSGPLGAGTGQPLNQQVAGTYNQALGQQNQLYGQGQQALGGGAAAGMQALAGANQMTGYTPQDIQAGQMSNTNLQPYMNPFTQGVIDTSMQELNRQEALQQRGVDDASQAAGAFGGDRWQIGKAAMNRDFDRTRRDTITNLYNQNFGQAQQAGFQDIGNRFAADAANQGMRQGMFGQGQNALGNLANMFGQFGINLSENAANQSGNLANMGFGWGADLEKRNMAMGGMQQAMIQDIINASKQQYGGYTGAPAQGLGYLNSSLPGGNVGGTTTSKNTQDPGLLGYLGTGISLLGLLNG